MVIQSLPYGYFSYAYGDLGGVRFGMPLILQMDTYEGLRLGEYNPVQAPAGKFRDG